MDKAARISAIATHLPAKTLTTTELSERFPEWAVDKIVKKTGIENRHIAADGETSFDLGVAAAERLFASTGVSRSEIDFLLFCTQSPDYFLPTTACMVQQRLDLSTTCGALDFNLGCSGFIYGIFLAKSMIRSGAAKQVLLITSETYSKYLADDDRSVRTIFGDGAAATLISACDAPGIGEILLGTDGRGAENLIVRNGAARAGFSGPLNTLSMNGAEILEFTMNAVPQNIHTLLDRAGLTIDNIDFFVLHQANAFILSQLRRKLGVAPEKFCINMQEYTNTVSATIPMALEKAENSGLIKQGDRILICGFGVGYSWGSALLTWSGLLRN